MYEYLFIIRSKLEADRWHRENRLAAARVPHPDFSGERSHARAPDPQARPLSEYQTSRRQP